MNSSTAPVELMQMTEALAESLSQGRAAAIPRRIGNMSVSSTSCHAASLSSPGLTEVKLMKISHPPSAFAALSTNAGTASGLVTSALLYGCHSLCRRVRPQSYRPFPGCVRKPRHAAFVDECMGHLAAYAAVRAHQYRFEPFEPEIHDCSSP